MNEEEKEWIAHALMEDERRRCISKVLKLDSKDAVATGNNYVSDIFRLNLKVVLNSGECEERAAIYKIIPRGEKLRLPDVKKSGLFTKEARVYTEILPEMEKLLMKIQPDAQTLWPQIYGVKSNHDGILMEDITVSGYKMADRLQGLDFEHTALALRALAQFHALAAVLIERGDICGTDFNEYHFQKTPEHKRRERVDEIFDSLIKLIEECWKEDEWLDCLESLKEMKNIFFQRLEESHQRDEKKFNTLNHGDFWLNNIMFKYDPEGRPLHLKMLDFQLIFYNSPCLDVQYHINSSLKPEVFHRKTELLSIYTSSLQKNLKFFGYGGEIPTLEEIMESYEKSKWFGYFIALFFRAVMSCPSVEDLMTEKKFDSQKALLYLCYENATELFRECLKSFLKELKTIGLQ